MTPSLPEGYTQPADKAACERIVRLILALGFAHEKVCVATRPFEGRYKARCFSLDNGLWRVTGLAYLGDTEQLAIAAAESDVRNDAGIFARQLREAAEATKTSAAQQLAIAADKIARADALDAALR